MLPGETLCSGASQKCSQCDEDVLMDLKNNAVWTFCSCGPYSRETQYAETPEEAIQWWQLMHYARKGLGVSWVQMPELFTFIRR